MNDARPAISLEVLAAITAVVAVAMDRPIGTFAVKSVQPVFPQPAAAAGAWAKAGVLESHLARRQFGLRSR